MQHQSVSRLSFGAVALLLGASALSGCESIPFIGGKNDEAKEVAEGEEQDNRVAALPIDEALIPDIRFMGQPLAIPPAYANASWTQPGGEADHTMHHLAAPERLARRWRTEIGVGGTDRSPLTAPPVAADGRVFAIDNEARVTAFDADTGESVWSTALTPEREAEKRKFYQIGPFGRGTKMAELGFGGGVALDGGKVFMVSGFGTAAALDQETGEVLWTATLSAPVRNPPTAANGKVFAITVGNQAVALDQETGEIAWTFESFEEAARFLSSASPAVAGGTVVVPFSSGEVIALQSDNGRLLWSTTVSRSTRMNAMADLNDIAGSPVIDRGAVFAISHAGQMSAIDLRTGQSAWEVPIGGLNTPWVSGDALFIVTVHGELVALSRDDGAIMWNTQLPRFENEKKRKDEITWAGPILAGGNLILTSSRGGVVLASPQDGSITEQVEGKVGASIPPIVAGGQVYVLDTEGNLNAYGPGPSDG